MGYGAPPPAAAPGISPEVQATLNTLPEDQRVSTISYFLACMEDEADVPDDSNDHPPNDAGSDKWTGCGTKGKHHAVGTSGIYPVCNIRR
jgi:hypothetical protein